MNWKSAGRPVTALPVRAAFDPAAPRIGGARRSRLRRRCVVVIVSVGIGIGGRRRPVGIVIIIGIIGPVGVGDGSACDDAPNDGGADPWPRSPAAVIDLGRLT